MLKMPMSIVSLLWHTPAAVAQGRTRVAAWVAGAVSLALPSVAFAESPPQGTSVADVVWVLVFVSGAYLLARLVVGHVERRFLIISGIEFIGLGALLGPGTRLVPVLHEVADVLPAVALTTGWLGLLRGLDLRTTTLRGASRGSWRLALLNTSIAGTMVSAAVYAVLQTGIMGAGARGDAALIAGFLGCAAATGGTEPLNIIGQRYRVEGPTQHVLRASARLGDAMAITIFGVVLALFRHPPTPGNPVPGFDNGLSWLLLAVLLGLVLGLLFSPFLGDDDSKNSQFLSLVGIVTVAAGAGRLLSLSSLFICLLVGAVLVNTTRAGVRIHATLEGTKRPLSLVLLVLAGIVWRPPSDATSTLLFLFLLVALRFFGKWVANRLGSAGSPLRRDLYRGQLNHGDAAVAMAIGMREVLAHHPAVDAAYTAVLASVVLHDFLAPRALRTLLVDSGELRREQAS